MCIRDRRNPEKVKQMLCEKVHSIARSNRRFSSAAVAPAPTAASPSVAPTSRPAVSTRPAAPAPVAPARPAPAAGGASASPAPKRKAYKLVAIGTSTGGPVALQRVLTQLPANFPAPIVLIQHMPAAFTKAFAERLDKLCRIQVKDCLLYTSRCV